MSSDPITNRIKRRKNPITWTFDPKTGKWEAKVTVQLEFGIVADPSRVAEVNDYLDAMGKIVDGYNVEALKVIQKAIADSEASQSDTRQTELKL